MLYNYYRSSASYRVRIALNYKNLPYECKTVNLIKDGGEQHAAEYLKLNPQGLVPTLTDGDLVLTQSIAILEYLEEVYPEPSLLPQGALERANVRAVVDLIACDTHPLNNLRVLQYLKNELDVNDEQKTKWYQHWIAKSFTALEKILQKHIAGSYCFGDQVTMADICLIPQVYNAHRFKCAMQDYPRINQINKHCLTLSAFVDASPRE